VAKREQEDKKMSKDEIAKKIVDAICAANDYTADSGLAANVIRRLTFNMPKGGLEELYTLVVLGNRWVERGEKT
jgi:hypothetical protein